MARRDRARLNVRPLNWRRVPRSRAVGLRQIAALLAGFATLFVALVVGVVSVSLVRGTGCGVASPESAPVAASRLPTTAVTGHPVAVAAYGSDTVFVSLSAWDAGEPNGVQIFRREATGLRHVAIIPLHSSVAGLAVSPDGRLLVAALDDQVAVLDAARAAVGDLSGLLGYVPIGARAGVDGITVTSRYVLASDMTAGQVSVLDLGRMEAGDFGPSAHVATVDLDLAPTGLATSPDGRYLYVTSQVQGPVLRMGVSDTIYGALTSLGLPRRAGTLSVIDLSLVELNPAGAVLARVPAGCEPVRVAVAPDGKTAWVTARQSNELLAFSTARLLAGRSATPMAQVGVGPAPIGLRLVGNGRYALVAGAQQSGDASSVSVVDTQAALAGRPAVRAKVTVGGLPREIGLAPDQRTAYVANNATSSVTSVDLTPLIG